MASEVYDMLEKAVETQIQVRNGIIEGTVFDMESDLKCFSRYGLISFDEWDVLNERLMGNRMKSSKLALRHGEKLLSFRNLPETAKMALIQYMFIDTECLPLEILLDLSREPWSASPLWGYSSFCKEPEKHLRTLLPYYIEEYGDFKVRFNIGISTQKIITAIMEDPRQAAFDCWQSYHKHFVTTVDHMPKHNIQKPLWPIILGGEKDEDTIQDGWHRFHYYAQEGIIFIPTLSF